MSSLHSVISRADSKEAVKIGVWNYRIEMFDEVSAFHNLLQENTYSLQRVRSHSDPAGLSALCSLSFICVTWSCVVVACTNWQLPKKGMAQGSERNYLFFIQGHRLPSYLLKTAQFKQMPSAQFLNLHVENYLPHR